MNNTPGTRRVQLPGDLYVRHVPRLECLIVSLETKEIDRKPGSLTRLCTVFIVFKYTRTCDVDLFNILWVFYIRI